MHDFQAVGRALLCADSDACPNIAAAIKFFFIIGNLLVLYAGIIRFRFYGYVLSPSC